MISLGYRWAIAGLLFAIICIGLGTCIRESELYIHQLIRGIVYSCDGGLDTPTASKLDANDRASGISPGFLAFDGAR